jgi:hypothetical protein
MGFVVSVPLRYSTAVITNSLLTSEQGVLFLTRCITPGSAQYTPFHLIAGSLL